VFRIPFLCLDGWENNIGVGKRLNPEATRNLDISLLRRVIMVRRLTAALLSFSFLLAIGSHAEAAIVLDHDASLDFLGAPLDGNNITVDTTNNTKWLDFTLTTGRSYNSVLADLLAPGKPLEGWWYATEQDWLNLAASVGIPASYNDSVSATPNAALETLKDALGRTYGSVVQAGRFSSVAISGVENMGSQALGSFGGITETSHLIELPNANQVSFDSTFNPASISSQVGSALVMDSSDPNPEPTTLVIDVKPGSDPNPINPNSKGVLPVGIQGTDDLDVNAIDWDTTQFGDPKLIADGGTAISPKRSSFEDWNDDGILDAVLKFSIAEMSDNNVIGSLTSELTLTGTFADGTMFQGTDGIRIVPSRNALIPEPSTFVLALLATLGLSFYRRRRRRAF